MILPVKSTSGPLKVWQEPQAGVDYVIGSDVSEGVRGGDYSAAVVIRADDCSVVATMRQHIAAELWGRKNADLAWWYNGAMLAFETYPAAYGLAACRAALEYGYTRLYQRIISTSAAPNPTEKLGFHTDKVMSGQMVEIVRHALRENAKIASRDIILELMGLKYDETVKIVTETHDDFFDAYAIARLVREQCIARNEIKVTVRRMLEEHEVFWQTLEQYTLTGERPDDQKPQVVYDGAIL